MVRGELEAGERMKKYFLFLVVLLWSYLLCGCTVMKVEEEKVQDLEYSIVNQEDQPEEVQILIADNKANKMKMSYTDQGLEYIIIGYGAQETSGYSVEVLEVYESENAVYVTTNLLGPLSGEEIVELPTYPYVVICIQENQKPIVYE